MQHSHQPLRIHDILLVVVVLVIMLGIGVSKLTHDGSHQVSITDTLLSEFTLELCTKKIMPGSDGDKGAYSTFMSHATVRAKGRVMSLEFWDNFSFRVARRLLGTEDVSVPVNCSNGVRRVLSYHAPGGGVLALEIPPGCQIPAGDVVEFVFENSTIMLVALHEPVS